MLSFFTQAVLGLLVTPSSGLDSTRVKDYLVVGENFPGTGLDLGTSYAGTLPISTSRTNSSANNETADSLFFWYFPSNNSQATNETLIWLSGGPGCSSLGALLQENGPLSWQPGLPSPSYNPFGWQLLTNTIYVEFPVGVGISQGSNLARNEDDAAEQFLGFWQNFVDLFDLQGADVYLSGESYAGMYVPYIASHMIDRNSSTYFNLQGSLLYDPSLASDLIMKDLPAVDFMGQFPQIFGFGDDRVQYYQEQADSCGFTKYLDDNLKYPPAGPFQLPEASRLCNFWTQISREALTLNPCFNVYGITTHCPTLPSPLKSPDSSYLPAGQREFFDRPDVKAALHAPDSIQWSQCVPEDQVFVNGIDQNQTANQYGPVTVLPRVIEHSQRTIIAHGDLDFDLLKKGSLLAIQNMTWAGQQGFSSAPNDTFSVPFSIAASRMSTGAGSMGVTRTERGLTVCSVKLSGHTVPQYQGGAAFRHVEYLLGRVSSLTSSDGFTAGE